MPDLARLSLSLESPLHGKLEMRSRQVCHGPRSELIRDLIRSRLVQARARRIRGIASLLCQRKGVLRVALAMGSTGGRLA